ncbi:response regulator [soil metagenome]
MAKVRSVTILMAEDSPSDAELARQAFKDGKLLNDLLIVKDGEECLAYLRKEGKYSSAIRPDLILLDLNMPKKGGLEVLEELKKDPQLMAIPVAILTTSESQQDILKSYQLQASSFITKPVEFEKFIELANNVKQFYFDVCTLPSSEGK